MKKLLLILLSSLIFLNSMVLPLAVHAAEPASAGTWYNQDFKTWYTKVADPTNPSDIFGERYTAAQVQWVVYGLFAFLINSVTGSQNTGLVQCFISKSENIAECAGELTKLIGSSENLTPVAQTNPKETLTSLVFADRPISGIGYVRQKLENFSLVPVAHAQTNGFGFSALEPVQKMWRGMRDLSYGLFVLVAIVFSFMIMFRVKISPQLVISVQSSIPKMLGALLATTFSFAIAGFLIDLMYVIFGFLSLLGPNLASFDISAPTMFRLLTTGSPIALGGLSGGGIMTGLFLYIFFLCIGLLATMMMAVGVPITAVSGGITAGIIAATAPISILVILLVFVIVVIIIFWMMLKTLWALIKAFANVLLLTIFAPLQITLGVLIPNFGFGAWIKSFAGALSVFVVTGVLLLFSYVFLVNGIALGFDDFFGDSFGGFVGNILIGSGFSGALQGDYNSAWPPLLGTGGTKAGIGMLFLGVSFVLFTLIPKATEIIAGFISGKPFAYGSAIGESVGPIGMIGKVGIGAALNIREEQRQKITRSSNPPLPYEPHWTTQAWNTLTGRH